MIWNNADPDRHPLQFLLLCLTGMIVVVGIPLGLVWQAARWLLGW